MSQNLVIVIAGPTASGKSQLAIDLAMDLNGVVINSDSMQVYQDTPILSACPSEADYKLVPHYLYQIFSASVQSSVFDWLDLAVAEIEKAFESKKLPIVVGGTGFYIDALVNGLTPIPETKPEIKARVKTLLEEKGVNELHNDLKDFDPVSYAVLKPNDVTRVRRAWEVYLNTGVPISEWQTKPKEKKIDAKFLVIRLLPETVEIDKRCYIRLDGMMKNGALDEVKRLSLKKLDREIPAMKALGVPELMAYIDGEITLDEAVESAKLHSRQYAKRQKTWFRNKLDANVTIDKVYNGQKDMLKTVLREVDNFR